MPLTLRERMQHSVRFAVRLLTSWRYWAVVAGAIMLFTAIGPFGTFESTTFWRRLAYWAVTMAGTSVVAVLFVALASGVGSPGTRTAFPVLMAGALVSCLPNTLLVQALIPIFLDQPARPFAEMLPTVLPIGLSVGVVTWLVFERGTGAAGAEPKRANALLDRLPVEKRGPVVRMSMQDHYIEVVTTSGRELVLMRMADAEAAMGDAGFRIHRSHWVGRDHIVATRRDGSQASVSTSDGEELPVSRSYVSLLKAEGLI